MVLKSVSIIGFFLYLVIFASISAQRMVQSETHIGAIAVIQPWFGGPEEGALDIVLVDINAQQIMNITQRQGHYSKPAISEDGRVAFVSSDEHDFEIYVYELSTQRMLQITDNEIHDTRPA